MKRQLADIEEGLKISGVIHRDINPGNMLFDGKMLKLIDFGWSGLRSQRSYIPFNINPEYRSNDNSLSDSEQDKYAIEKINELINKSAVRSDTANIESLSKLKTSNLKVLEEELSSYTDADTIVGSRILFRLAEEYLKSGDKENAKELLQQELILRPDFEDTFGLLQSLVAEETNSEKSDFKNKNQFQISTTESKDTKTILEADDSWEDFPSQTGIVPKDLDNDLSDTFIEEEEIVSVNVEADFYDVSIVIPCYDRPDLTYNCVRSIFGSNNLCSYELLIVDNGGLDDRLRDYLIDKRNIRILGSGINLGFARACNIGLKERSGTDALLLNNDTVVSDGWLDGLRKNIAPKDGIIGGLLIYPNSTLVQHCWVELGTEDGTSMAPYHAYQYADLAEEEYASVLNQMRQVPAVTGACMYITKECLQEVGPLDEKFVNGLEDIDYCLHAQSKNFNIRYSPECVIFHYEGMSKGRHDRDIDNWKYFNQKWIGKVSLSKNKEQTKSEVREIKNRSNSLEIDKSRVLTQKLPNKIVEKEYLNNIGDKKTTELSVIILAHNNIDFTITCLESLFRTDSIGCEIIVVDNASSDDTSIYLNNLEDRISSIRNSENLSFSRANNLAAAKANGKYLLFLNNDIELIPGWCERLISQFQQNPRTGVVGAKLLYPDNSIQHAGIVFGKVSDRITTHYHIYLGHNRYDRHVCETRNFQMVTGAFLAIRRELFDSIGGFDEKYIFGYEDLDLCLKASQEGYDVVYNHGIEAYHHESITKKSEGLYKFESFLVNPDGIDSINRKYFLSKWKDRLELDADNYYNSDGFYGLVSDPVISKRYTQRLNRFLRTVQGRLIDKPNIINSLSQILFGNSSVDFVKDPKRLIHTSAFNLTRAEAELGISEEDQSAEKIASDKLPRVLMTMWGWEHQGGGTRFPKAIAEKLAADGFEIGVFYANPDNGKSNNPELQEKHHGNVKLYSVTGRAVPMLTLANPEMEVEDEGVVSLFERVIEEFNPDIVHFHNFVGLSFAIAEVAKRKGLPSFYTPHNYHLIDPMLYMIDQSLKRWNDTDLKNHLPQGYKDQEYRFDNRIRNARELLRSKIGRTIAVSTTQARILKDFAGDNGRISVVNQVSDIVSLSPVEKRINKEGKLRVSYVGSVIPQKGVHLLSVALELFKPGEIEVNIYGDGETQYQNFIKQIANSHNITFHGRYSNSEFSEICNKTDVMVMPSLWQDCAPLVISETLSYGVPCIVPDIGGFSDFIEDGFNGLIFKANSAHSLANAIKRLEKDRSELENITNNCFLPYGFDYYITHIENLYQKAFYKMDLISEEVNLKFKELLFDKSDDKRKEENTRNNTKKTLFPINIESKESRQYPEYGFSIKRAIGRLPEQLPEVVRLNLGCGQDVRDGFINIDKFSDNPTVVYADIRKLDFPDGSVDYILASDILEHFPHGEVIGVLKEWSRVLKKGGIMTLRMPNLRLQTKAYMEGKWDADIASYMIFGGQTNPGDFHHIAFDHTSITKHLNRAGLKVEDIKDEDYPQDNGYINLNMTVTAVKEY
ncbi:MAG: hypothetical protein Kapaf2KO_00520 [Candidatus Kapaibacteriales bacterium]